ncbi:MAG: nuclear transport factor 2 family protein [Desulfarculus sp.]|nr:nuclear transport factor 2 family protein [Desulfarculus sp.]
MDRRIGVIWLAMAVGCLLLAGAAPRAGAAGPAGREQPAPREDLARAELVALLGRAALAYQRQDLAALEAMADEHLEVQVRGLGQDQTLRGRGRVRAVYGPHLKALASPRLDLGQPQISFAGQRASLAAPFTAWAAAELLPGLGAGGQTLLPLPGHIRALVERRKDKWVILRLEVILPGGSQS